MATSKLQRYTGEQLSLCLNGYPIKENSRPDWLITPRGERLELDFWIEPLAVAVEVQGLQHVQYSPFFHSTKKAFYDQLRRDKAKKQICLSVGIDLYYVFGESDLPWLIDTLYETKEELARKRELLTAYDFARRPKNLHPAAGKQRYYLRCVASLRDSLLDRNQSGDLENSDYQKRLRQRLRRIRGLEAKYGIIASEDVSQFVDLAQSLAVGGIDKRVSKWASEPTIGRSRTRNKGRKLHVRQFSDNLYLVWGGESPHRVWGERERRICDCSHWHDAKDGICCHVYAVILDRAMHLT